MYEEVVEARGDAPGAQEVGEASWVQSVEADPHLVATLRVLVDRGEAEAIAVALDHPGSLLLTDDGRARKVAKQAGVEVQGTLGVLGRAKRRGMIAAIRPLAARLQTEGLRISEKELEVFLRRSGE